MILCETFMLKPIIMEFRMRMPKVNLNNISLVRTDVPYYVSYGLFLVYMVMTHVLLLVDIDFLWKPVFLLCILLLAIKELITDSISHRAFTTMCYMLPAVLIIASTVSGPGGNSLIMIFTFAFSARTMDFRKIAKFSFVVLSALLAFVVVCANIGVIRNYNVPEARVRRYLGFRYALFGPALFFNIVCLWVYLKKKDITLISVLIFSIINLYLYRETDSRLSFFLAELVLLAGIALKWLSKPLLRSKLLCLILVLSFAIGALTSLVVTVNYTPAVRWQEKTNTLLGGRFALGQKSIEKYGIHFLANDEIEWVGNGLDANGQKVAKEYLYVDSYYLQILQRYGILVFMTITCAYTIASYRSYKKGDIYLLAILAFKAMHCVIDDSSQYLEYNTFWLAIGILLLCESPLIVKRFPTIGYSRAENAISAPAGMIAESRHTSYD